MLIIEKTVLSNGAHRNQIGSFDPDMLPDGWLPVLPEIEEEAVGYLPFIEITGTENGYITGVAQGVIPDPEPEPPAPPTAQERIDSLEAAIANGLDLYRGDLGNA